MIAVNQNMGMSQDLSPINPDYEKFYYEGKNITLLFDQKSSQFLLSNEGGTTPIFTLPNITLSSGTAPWASKLTISLGSDYSIDYNTVRPTTDFLTIGTNKTIIGHALGDSELYICSTNGNTDQIWRFSYTPNFDGTEPMQLVWAGDLGWQTTDRLKVELNYENEDIIKLYFIDGRTCIRSINVAKTLDINTLDHPLNLAPKALDSCPEIWLPQLEITNTYDSGRFTKGMVQYTYCLYNRHGNSTKIAPLSNLAPISKDGKGHPNAEYGTSSFELTLSDLDPDFEKLRVFRLHYSENDAVTVSEIYNGQHNGSFLFTDTGTNDITILTLSDILNIGSPYFVPKTFGIQDNRLFLGNVEEEEIDLSGFDTRAYRYKSVAGPTFRECSIYPHNNNVTPDKTFSGSTFPNLTTEKELDCVNFSDYSYSSSDPFANQFMWANGAGAIDIQDVDEIGASGPNVEVRFKRVVNPRITNYLGHNYKYRQYKSNEVYRFGVRFITKRNSYSDVKWIIDLRIPHFYVLNRIVTSELTANPLVNSNGVYVVTPHFTLKNLDTLPDNILGYQIVRCIRGESNRNILDQGIINPVMYNPKASGGDWSETYTPNPGIFFKGAFTAHSYDSAYTKLAFTYNANYTGKLETLQFYSPRLIILGDNKILQANLSQAIGSTFSNQFTVCYRFADNWSNTNETGLYKLTTSADNATEINNLYRVNSTFDGTGAGPDALSDSIFEGIDSMTKIIILNSPGIFVNVNSPINLNTVLPYLNVPKVYYFHDRIKESKQIEEVGRPFINSLRIENSFGNDKTVIAIGSKCGVYSLLGGDLVEDYDASNILYNGTYIIDLIKVNVDQYGGRSYQARQTNEYIPCSEVVKIESSEESCYALNGDTFLTQFNFHRIYPEGTSTDNTEFVKDTKALTAGTKVKITFGEFTRITQESDLNLELREDVMLDYLDELNIVQTSEQKTYTYNEIYNRQDNTLTFRAESDFVNEVLDFRYLVRYSHPKFYNEPYDSFTNFAVNDFKECPSNLGEITNLIPFNNLLYTYQTNGIGYWITNPMATVGSSSGNVLIGTGQVLQKHIIIDDKNGTSHFNSVVKGERGLYSIDTMNKRFMKISGGKEPAISDIKGLYKLLNSKYPIHSSDLIVSLGYDPQTYNVYCSIIDTITPTNSITFSYNEISDSFISLHDFVADRYFSDRERFYSVPSLEVHGFNRISGWLHNYSLSTNIYGTERDWYITYVSNKEGLTNKLFSNLEYKLEIVDEDNNYLPFDGNFKTCKLWVENQDTGLVVLDDPRIATMYNNKWRIVVKRDINSRNQKGRINNAYVFITLTGRDSRERKYKMYPLIVHYEHLIY